MKRKCSLCGKPTARLLCSHCLANHCPTPDHHVAKERMCIRCETPFASTWSGDRICTPCRVRERELERNAINRGITHGHYESPLEPDHIPEIGA